VILDTGNQNENEIRRIVRLNIERCNTFDFENVRRCEADTSTMKLEHVIGDLVESLQAATSAASHTVFQTISWILLQYVEFFNLKIIIDSETESYMQSAEATNSRRVSKSCDLCVVFQVFLIKPLETVRPIYRTGTPLPSKHPILRIFSTNIRTDFFKHAAHSPFCLLKMPFIS
jgi:hypothetical protein